MRKMLKETFKTKALQIFWVYAIVFGVMWTMYIVNNLVMAGALSNLGGISPRTVSWMEGFAIMTSWAFHGDYKHIVGNSSALLGLLAVICLLEKKPIFTISILAVSAGLATWLLGISHSNHIGASGLVFAIFGYVLASALWARKWLYLLVILAFGGQYYYSLTHGLIPTQGVSMAAHFGGFLAGIAVAVIRHKYNKTQESTGYSYRANQDSAWGKFKTKIRRQWTNLKYNWKFKRKIGFK